MTRRTKMTLRFGALGMTAILCSLGWMVSNTLNKPMNVTLRTHIQICKQVKGTWQVIDEVGPETVTFQASLNDLAQGQGRGSQEAGGRRSQDLNPAERTPSSQSRKNSVQTSFTYRTTTKKGIPYEVRLSKPGSIDFNPITGEFTTNLSYDIKYGGKRAIVNGKQTTESVAAPIGAKRGRRASGILTKNATTATLVASNTMRVGGEELRLVCQEEYRITPIG